MKRRVHVEMRGGSQKAANGHRTWVAAQLTGKSLLSAEDLPPTVINDGGWVCVSQTRFLISADADVFYTANVTRMAAESTVTAGSRVHWHDCTHDDPVPQPCVISAETVK